jgi:hypothetical protein
MDWKSHLTHQSTTLDAFRKAHPDAARGFTALHHGTLAEGALSVREKELQALAIGIVSNAPTASASMSRPRTRRAPRGPRSRKRWAWR